MPYLKRFLGFGLAMLTCVLTVDAQTNSTAARVRGLTDELLRVQEENQRIELFGDVQRGTGGAIFKLRREAANLIEERAAALSELIEVDPNQALTLALSPEVLADLKKRFPEATPSLEWHGTWKGEIEQWVFDDASLLSRTVTRLRAGQQDLELHFAGPNQERIQSGDVLEATGVVLGSKMVVASSTVQAITTAQTCSTTGVQNTAVLLVTFPGVTLPSTVTPQTVHDTFFGSGGHSLDGFWREASYGKTSATGDVFGQYTLDRSYSCNEASLMRDAAISMATSAGANFQDYTRVFIVYPNIGCTAGFAQVGCSTLNSPSGPFTGSTSYIEADYMSGDSGVCLAAHEGGHNLGLLHSGTQSFAPETLGVVGASGTITEMNDVFSTMGGCGSYIGHYAAPHKAEVLKWLDPTSNYQVVQRSGVWSIQPLEANSTGVQALKVQRGTGNDAWLWIEYRQPIGAYDSRLPYTQAFSGALIHYVDSTTGGFTHLLDFTPDGTWDTWWAPALAVGNTWVDPYSNLSIAVQNADANALTVAVNYGADTCTHANPTVSLSPPNPSAVPGTDVGYTISLTNNDTTACPANTFSLSSGQPYGWPSSFSVSSLTVGPGQTATATMIKSAPLSTSAGLYVVDTKAVAGMFAGSGVANMTITTAPMVTVGVSTGRTTYTVRDTVSINVSAWYGTKPAPNAPIRVTITDPSGVTTAKNLTTNSTGQATWNYKTSAKSPVGLYAVIATATYNAQTATSNRISFSLQ